MADAAPPPGRAQITGLILAGGQARRMGGRDKGLIELHGQPLLAHVHARFAPQVGRVWISANRPAGHYAPWAEQVVADAPAWADAGPLAGVASALARQPDGWLATVACDMPQLPTDLVARLAAGVAHGAQAAVAETAGRLQPVCMLIAADLADSLTAYLAGGGRRVGQWLRAVEAVRVPFADSGGFTNVNTPDELLTLATPA